MRMSPDAMTSTKMQLGFNLVISTVILMLSDFDALVAPAMVPSTVGLYVATVIAFYGFQTNNYYKVAVAPIWLVVGMYATMALSATNREARLTEWFVYLVATFSISMMGTIALQKEFQELRERYDQHPDKLRK
jgi:hypothetical protein